MTRETVLATAFDAGYRDPLAPSLFAEGPVAAAATRAARGIAAMLGETGHQASLDEVLRVWSLVEVCVPTTGGAALDAMELQLANMCAESALPATGMRDILHPLYDVTGDADDEEEYRREVSALADPALARRGHDGGTPAYRTARARLVDVLLADYHRARIATIDHCVEEIAPGMDTGRWGVLSAIRAEAWLFATAGAHLRALRPAAEPLTACARVVAALTVRAKRRDWLDAHARVTLALRRAYHERRLATLGGGDRRAPCSRRPAGDRQWPATLAGSYRSRARLRGTGGGRGRALSRRGGGHDDRAGLFPGTRRSAAPPARLRGPSRRRAARRHPGPVARAMIPANGGEL